MRREILKLDAGRVEIATVNATLQKFVAVFEHSHFFDDAWIVDAADMLNNFLSSTVKMGSRNPTPSLGKLTHQHEMISLKSLSLANTSLSSS